MEALTMIPFAMGASYGAFALLVMPFVLYVVARWRAHRDPLPDPQLGIKLVLGYFAVLGFQLALAGLTLFFYAVLSSSSSHDKSDMYRGAFGLLVPGSIVLATHLSLLRRTNQDQFPGARRIVLGFNLFLTASVGLIALVLAFEALFARGSSGELGRVAGAMVLVYGSAWAATGFQFGRLVLGGYSPPGEPPGVGPPVTPSQGASSSGPSLPSLRDGAYPPLDRK